MAKVILHFHKTLLFAGVFIFFFSLLSFIPFSQTKEDPVKLLEDCLKKIDEIKGLKYHLKIVERSKKGGYNHYESAVKIQKKPRKIYIYIKGIEVLWVEGWNKNKALVKPNSFPYMNLNLDPLGDLMRQDQHHTLYEMGYDYFAEIIHHYIYKFKDKTEMITYEGTTKKNYRNCHKVVIHNNDFGYIPYVVKENESITSIARKFYIPEYLIVEKNKKFKDYFEILKKGETILIPNSYCKKVEIYIDAFYNIPLSIRVEDDKGLFEEYNYFFVIIDPEFEKDEFTKNFREYKF
ncbi:MAG: DUF1571 domain-containing protein [Bacteroidia bacterium]|nr:DUF1571 domain-containing protein [Bacteroidia bacterium]